MPVVNRDETLLEHVRTYLDACGLESFKFRKEPDGSSLYAIRDVNELRMDLIHTMRFKFEETEASPARLFAEVQRVMEPLSQAIQNSLAVKDALKKVTELEEKISKLRTEVQDLKRYKTYYGMQFVLTHGKPIEGTKIPS